MLIQYATYYKVYHLLNYVTRGNLFIFKDLIFLSTAKAY